MPIIQWTEKLSVSVVGIDAHHKVLIDMINQLHDAMRSGKVDQELGDILDKLIEYTDFHFKYEENLMGKNGYPGMVVHKNAHKLLIDQVLDLQAKFKKGQAGLSIHVINFLKDWLANHILGEDKKFGAYLNTKGIK